MSVVSVLLFFFFLPLSCLQTEVAKRLNAIIAQILPFLSQEVSECFVFFYGLGKYYRRAAERGKLSPPVHY